MKRIQWDSEKKGHTMHPDEVKQYPFIVRFLWFCTIGWWLAIPFLFVTICFMCGIITWRLVPDWINRTHWAMTLQQNPPTHATLRSRKWASEREAKSRDLEQYMTDEERGKAKKRGAFSIGVGKRPRSASQRSWSRRPPDHDADPDSPPERFHAMMKRIQWDPQREAMIDAILRQMVEFNQRKES